MYMCVNNVVEKGLATALGTFASALRMQQFSRCIYSLVPELFGACLLCQAFYASMTYVPCYCLSLVMHKTKLILLCSAWEAAAMREPLAPVHTVHSIVIGSLRVSEASQQRSGLSDQSAMSIALTSYSKRRVQTKFSPATSLVALYLGFLPLSQPFKLASDFVHVQKHGY